MSLFIKGTYERKCRKWEAWCSPFIFFWGNLGNTFFYTVSLSTLHHRSTMQASSHRSSLQMGQIFYSNPVFVSDSTRTRNMWTRPVTTPLLTAAPCRTASPPRGRTTSSPPSCCGGRPPPGGERAGACSGGRCAPYTGANSRTGNKNRLCSMTCGIENKL